MKRVTRGITGIMYGLLTVLFLVPASAEEPKPDALAARDVLDRMAKTYAECKSYRDSGMGKIKIIEPQGKFVQATSFSTVFVRPKRFRFEYTQKQMFFETRRILWCNGNEVKSWWSVQPGIKKEESLGMAVAGATGVSGGSAHTIPALLLPNEVGGRCLTDLTEAKRIEDDHIGKVACFRINGNYGDSPMTLWLDQKQFLVRRMDSQRKFKDFRTEETTTYEPVIEEKIAEKLLEFNPPHGE
jgi:outer membrane lipoprotein-sorting protein